MPPGLISSAAPGKKAAAPKAAPRRRAAAANPTGPPPSAAAPLSESTSAPPPTSHPTQTPVIDGSVQQEEEARPHDSEIEPGAQGAASPTTATIADDVAPRLPVEPAGSEAVERARETAHVVAAPPSPDLTQIAKGDLGELEAQRGNDGERQRQDEDRVRVEQEESLRQEELRQAARHEELAVKARQAAEQDETARQSQVVTTVSAVSAPISPAPVSIRETNAAQHPTYVSPSAASATAAIVDPTTLPLPTRPSLDPKLSAKRPRMEKPVTARKKAKTSSARSNAKVQAVVDHEGETDVNDADVVSTTETDGAQSNPRQKRKPAQRKAVAGRKRKDTSVANNQDTNDEPGRQAEGDAGAGMKEAEVMAAPAKPRKPRAKRAPKNKPAKATAPFVEGAAEAGDLIRGDIDGLDEEAEHDGSDPELHEIDPNTISMWELARDEYHGKKSERGKKMAEINWEKVAQDRRDAANALVASLRTDAHLQRDPSDGVMSSVEGPSGTAEPEGSQGRRSQSRAANAVDTVPTPAPVSNDLGLGFVLDADGNIIADENTMTFTRDAEAQAAANTDAPIEDFTDLTQTVNRFTHLNANRRDPADRVPVWKSKSDPWSEDETDKFYDALRMFGTDFFIISKMFAPKTRRMIKNKFNREEKLDPDRINRALTGIVETPMSLEHYSRETGYAIEKFTKYDGIQHAQSVIDSENVGKEVVNEKEAKRREKEAAKEEREREKEREKEERKAKRKARTKKGIAEAGGAGFGGGGPIEDVVGGAD